MRKLVKDYLGKGYNCCAAVVISANEKYNLNISIDSLKLTSCISNGMGFGCLCSAIIGGVMVIGYMFEKKYSYDYNGMNRIRLKFIDGVNSQLKSINCSRIITLPIAKKDCTEVIAIIADVLEKVIMEFI